MSEGEGIPMWMRVCGGVGVGVFIISFLAPEFPPMLVFYVLPFFAVSLAVGFIFKSIAMSQPLPTG